MQAPSPLVTVGIPTYNRPEGLEKTIISIINQTYKNISVLVSDNCSTNTEVLPILQKYAGLDDRVKFVVQEKNLTLVPNFQYLLDHAAGKYFMWAADDDQWSPGFIETCVRAMEARDDIAIAMTTMDLFDEAGNMEAGKLNRSFIQPGIFSRSFHFIKSPMQNKFFLCGLYRTSMVKNVPFDNSWGGEHLFLYELITKGKFFLVEGAPLFHYFKGGTSKTNAAIRKAFNIKNRFYFLDAYIFRYLNYQFKFKHLSFLNKIGLFFSNSLALLFNEDYILYYSLIKKPVRSFINKFKSKPVEYRP